MPSPDVIIDDQGQVLLYRSWLTHPQSTELYQNLIDEIAWRCDQIRVCGRWITIPRQHAWCGDPGINYTYSHLTLKAQPWSKALSQLKAAIAQQTDWEPNGVLLNHYRHGQDSMGYHADDEPALGADPTIVSLSLGGTRAFLMRKKDRSRRHRLWLTHGDLLIMQPPIQRHWQHAIPKSQRFQAPRINLTWRRIITT